MVYIIAGSEITVSKGARRVLAFVFDVLNVVAQPFFIGPEFAVTAQLILLMQQALHHILLVAKRAPAAGGLSRRLRWVPVGLIGVVATRTLLSDASHCLLNPARAS